MKKTRKAERGNKGKYKAGKGVKQGSGSKAGGRKARSKKLHGKGKKRRVLQRMSRKAPQQEPNEPEPKTEKKRKAKHVEEQNLKTPCAKPKAKPAAKPKPAAKGKAKAKARGRPKVEFDPCETMKASALFDPELVQELVDFAKHFPRKDRVTSAAFKLKVRTLVPQCGFENYRLNLYWTTTRCGVTDTRSGKDIQSYSFNTSNADEPWRVAVSALCACKTATKLS